MALAPNANVALSGRRRFTTTSTTLSFPASATNAFTVSFLIDPGQTFNNQGIYLDDCGVTYIPLDDAGLLEILAINMGFSLTAGANVRPVGTPVSTFTSPAGPVNAIIERDKIILVNDLVILSQMLTVVPDGAGLEFLVSITCKNQDAASTHSILLRPLVLYYQLNGIIE
jgi:hypothetical protein